MLCSQLQIESGLGSRSVGSSLGKVAVPTIMTKLTHATSFAADLARGRV